MVMIIVDSDQPINQNFGWGEGTPIARYYLNSYMRNFNKNISGLVLEFGEPTYAQSCNCTCEIIDIDPTNSRANIHGDICNPTIGQEYVSRYDVIICTAVLQYVTDPQMAVVNMRNMLKEGGSLILAQQALSRIDPNVPAATDRWRFTQHGIAQMMKDFKPLHIRQYGNVYAICAYMLGLPAEKVDINKLRFADPSHPVITVAHGKKYPSCSG
jgi:hypothetical protein